MHKGTSVTIYDSALSNIIQHRGLTTSDNQDGFLHYITAQWAVYIDESTVDPQGGLWNNGMPIILQTVQEDQKKLKLNGIYQLLAYADDINLLDKNIYISKIFWV